MKNTRFPIKIIYRESAYALPSILILNTLIVSLLLGIITITVCYNIIDIKKIKKKKHELACISFINEYITKNEIPGCTGEFITVDRDTIHFKSSLKGLFEECEISAFNKNDSVVVKYLLADSPDSIFTNAVIISRPHLRASYAGMTSINGDMLVTKNRITKGTIYGIQNSQSYFLNGNIIVDENLKTKFLNDSLFRNIFETPAELANKDSIIDGDLVLNNENNQSFLNRNICIKGDLEISGDFNFKDYPNINFHLDGETVIKANTYSNIDMSIYSDSTVIVEQNCRIKNLVIISGGDIEVQAGSVLTNTQLYSKKNISISNSTFLFPSITGIYVDADSESNFHNEVSIHSSVINGSILLISSVAGLTKNKSKIYISSDSKVQGLIYSENFLELLGEVTGSVYTYSFLYMLNGNEYINWLVNVKIDRHKLDKWFLAPFGFAENKKQILSEKWIY